MKRFLNILLLLFSIIAICASAVIAMQWIYSWFDSSYHVDQAAGLFAVSFVVFTLSEVIKDYE